MNICFAKAKFWSMAKWLIEVALFVGGVIAVFVPAISHEYPPAALVTALILAGVSARTEKLKGLAETLKRDHEYWQGFGRTPSLSRLADLQVCTGKLSEAENQLLRQGLIFSSDKTAGPARVVENLVESAWFTKHLSGWCRNLFFGVFVISLILSVVLLLITAFSVAQVSSRLAAAKCVSATLTFLISVGVLREWLSFMEFSKNAGEIEAEAERLSHREITEFEAQRLLAEYQMIRAAAPLIPTFVWKLRRETLNETWKQLKYPRT